MAVVQQGLGVVGGIDTHKDAHAVVAITTTGELLGTAQFAMDPSGYRNLLEWLRAFGGLVRIGIEGTGSYGASLTRYLRSEGIPLRRGHSTQASVATAMRQV